MQPITFITGILLGTSGAIFFGLSVVLLLFWLLGTDEPRVAAELDGLVASTGIFLVMTAISAASFVGLVRRAPWRWPAQAAMWLGVGLVIWYFVGDL